MEILSENACAANASAAVMRAEVDNASTERTARHIMTYIVPPGDHSSTLKTNERLYEIQLLYVIRDKFSPRQIQSKTKFSPRQNSVF